MQKNSCCNLKSTKTTSGGDSAENSKCPSHLMRLKQTIDLCGSIRILRQKLSNPILWLLWLCNLWESWDRKFANNLIKGISAIVSQRKTTCHFDRVSGNVVKNSSGKQSANVGSFQFFSPHSSDKRFFVQKDFATALKF